MAKKAVEPDSFESLLMREIQMVGLPQQILDLTKATGFLNELSFTLRRQPHEGKLPHSGAIFLSQAHATPDFEVIRMPATQINLARTLADGIRSFVVFERGEFFGLGKSKEHGFDEYLLIEFLERSNAQCILTGDSTGVTKAYTASGVVEHNNRRWLHKGSVRSVLSKIETAVPQAPKNTLKQVLEFALHILSPRKIGASLVISLRPPDECEWAQMKPQIDLSALKLNLKESDHRAVLRHCLSQVDGATLFDANGYAVGTGVHLKCSDKSISLIRELAGTRHTSAKRFSYDYAAGVIVTVSADGPVTVFSDGVNLAEIYWRPAEVAAAAMKRMMPDRRDDVTADDYSRVCDTCGKTSIVSEVVILGWKEREEANCQVCGAVLETTMCFTLNANIIKVL